MGVRDLKTPEDKILRAIIELQKLQPFYAYLLAKLEPVAMPDKGTDAGKRFKMRTAGVTAKGKLFYDREWIMTNSEDEMLGLSCHEVHHVAFCHPLRTGGRDRNLANIAQDIEANYYVQASGLKVPKGAVPVDVHANRSVFNIGKVKFVVEDVKGKAWEEIYDELYQQADEQGAVGGGLPGTAPGFDEHQDGDGEGGELTPEETAEIERDWQKAIAEAANYAKQQGKLPAGIQRLVDKVLKPRVYWPQYLLRYLRPHLTPVDYSFRVPHKKSQLLGVYMPSVVREHCEVEVLVDTSGSIGGDLLESFMTEIVGIAKAHPRVQMWVSFVDTQVHSRYRIENASVGTILAMKPAGGGGTSMEAGLDYIKTNNRDASVAVVLTDGYDSWNRKRRDYPFDVIWTIAPCGIGLADAKQRIPYGVKIKMDGCSDG